MGIWDLDFPTHERGQLPAFFSELRWGRVVARARQVHAHVHPCVCVCVCQAGAAPLRKPGSPIELSSPKEAHLLALTTDPLSLAVPSSPGRQACLLPVLRQAHVPSEIWEALGPHPSCPDLRTQPWVLLGLQSGSQASRRNA